MILSIWLLIMLVLVNSFSGQFKALLMVAGKGDVLTGIADLAARKELVTHFPDYHLFYQCFQVKLYRTVDLVTVSDFTMINGSNTKFIFYKYIINLICSKT